jgi:hypothetical protein
MLIFEIIIIKTKKAIRFSKNVTPHLKRLQF